MIACGFRADRPVVLKVMKREGDEWRSGDVLSAFDGRGVVRVLDHAPGALLTERLNPGTSLVEMSIAGQDEAATAIIARVIHEMSSTTAPAWCPSVLEWGRAFAWYATIGDSQIPESVVRRAESVYLELASSQRNTHLLHGDLQHSNVLFDRDRGWLAIDPKGVRGEIEFEVGAALRNPREAPALVGDPATLHRRLDQFVSALSLDRPRVVGWAFAQAVLSLIWTIQDSPGLDPSDPSRLLVDAILPLLARSGF